MFGDPYNFSNRITKFGFFARNNNYNKYVSVPFYRGFIISCLNVLTRCGVLIPP